MRNESSRNRTNGSAARADGAHRGAGPARDTSRIVGRIAPGVYTPSRTRYYTILRLVRRAQRADDYLVEDRAPFHRNTNAVLRQRPRRGRRSYLRSYDLSRKNGACTHTLLPTGKGRMRPARRTDCSPALRTSGRACRGNPQEDSYQQAAP